jgi:hypothetical protein
LAAVVLAGTPGTAVTAFAQKVENRQTPASADPATPVNPLQKRFLTGKPLEICDQGAFFVGGVPKIPSFGAVRQTIIGSMYTQFQIPTKRRQWPIIFIHGGNYTGSALEATPDGREGWLPHALRRNYATFVVDRPGYGRAGFDSSVLNEARATNNLNLLPNIAESTSDIWTNTGQRGFGLIIPEGSDIITGTMIRHGDPHDPRMPETDPPSDFHGAYPPAFPIPPVPRSIDANIKARVGAIGPAPNPANNAFLALNAYKWVVPGMDNLFPGSVCETCNPTNIAPGNTWAPLALAELVERLGGAILSPHSQSSDNVLHMVRILKERGKLHLVKGVIVPETTVGGTNTPNFTFERFGITAQDLDHIPYLIANGDYRVTSIRINNRDFIHALNASPTRAVGPATYIDLDSPEFGDRFLGTTHIVQLGTNNIDLLDFLLDWGEDNIDNPIVTSACRSGPPPHPGKGPRPGKGRLTDNGPNMQ